MSETDLQLGGGYTYQWQCAVLLALNYFFDKPLKFNPILGSLVENFLGSVSEIHLEGEERNNGIYLEDINLFNKKDRCILIQVKTKQAEGKSWTPADPLLLKSFYRFCENLSRTGQGDNCRFMFLTNRPFNTALVNIKNSIDVAKGTFVRCKEMDNLYNSLNKFAAKEKKEPVNRDTFNDTLGRTAFIEYLGLDEVKADVQALLMARGRSDFEVAYALLFDHFVEQSTRRGGGKVNPESVKKVLESTAAPSWKYLKKKGKQIKILSMTASPEGEGALLYEREQDTLLDAFRGFDRREIFLDMPDPVRSTMAEIEDNLKDGRHDILQITAHGSVDEQGKGVLAFEDEQGKKAEVGGEQLAELLLRLKKENKVNVSLVILSSCHSARKELHLMPTARMLHEAGIPAVIGMKESVSHLAAIDFNVGFFTALKELKTVEQAFEAGTQAVAAGEVKRLRDMPNWDRTGEEQIPQLLLNKKNLGAKDFSSHEIAAPARPESHQFLGARHLDRGFIGRRDILRKIYKQVEERVGAVVLKGPGGIGKSTLTTRVTANLRRKGYDFIVIRGETAPESILQAIAHKAAALGVVEAEQVNAASAEVEQKLAWFLENFLSKEKLLFICDNFEENQTLEGEFNNQRLKEFLWYFRDCLKGKDTLLLFSTRYHIPGFEPVNVGEFSPVECRKLLFNHRALKNLEEKSMRTLLFEIGGNPRALELLDKIAFRIFGSRAFTWLELKELIPGLTERILTSQNKEDDFTPLFLQKLLLYINDVQRRLLDRLAIYRYPVNKDALVAQEVDVHWTDCLKLQELSLIEYEPGSAFFTCTA